MVDTMLKNNKSIIFVIVNIVVMVVFMIVTPISIEVGLEKYIDEHNISFFTISEDMDDIEWIGVAEDGVSTCIVEYEEVPYYCIVPGKYIIGTEVNGCQATTLYPEYTNGYAYDRFDIYVYDIKTGEKRFLIDVLEVLESYPGMQVSFGNRCAVIDGQDIYQRNFELYPHQGGSYEDENRDYLCINVVDGSYSIEEEKAKNWNSGKLGIFTVPEDDQLLWNNLPSDMMAWMEDKWSGASFYVDEYENYEGVFEVSGLAECLPEHNEALYGMFPELEQYRGEEDCYIRMYIAGNPSAEELLRLFMEDGQEISFENVVLDGMWSTDGQEHELRCFEDFEQCWMYSDR